MTAAVVGPATSAGPVADVGAGQVPAARRRQVWHVIPEASTLLAVGWFLLAVTRGWGGRDAGVVSVGAVLLAAAFLAVRPDRVLPRAAISVAAALSVSALTVAVVAPTGWAGAAVGSSYVAGAWLTLVVAALVRRRPAASLRLAIVVAAAGAVEFSEAWLPWWGGEDPARPMIGTFYWHDPYAAFLVPTAIVGLGLFLWHRRTVALLGGVAFVLAAVGVVHSTSRAALACLVVGAVALAGAAAAGRQPLRGVIRAVLAAGFAAAATTLVAGPPFFPHREAALAGIGQRAAHESLAQNGGYRLQFWQEALTVFRHRPVTGAGYHSMAAASVGEVPHGWALSPYAHNGYLQMLSDGGLLLALPFLLAVAAVTVVVLRLLWRSLRHRQPSVLGVAVPLALGAALAHSAVDFDWAYAANVALAAVLAGLVLGHWWSRGAESEDPVIRETAAGGGRRLGASLVVGLAVSTLGLAAWGAKGGDPRENLPLGAPTGSTVKTNPVSADSEPESARGARSSPYRALPPKGHL